MLSSSVSRNLNFHVFQKQTLSLLSLASLRTIWRAEALRRVALLAPLSGAERSALAAALQPRVVEAGSDVVVAGEAGAEFFLVESGELDVLAPPKGDATSAAAPVAAAPAAAAAAAAADVAASEDGEKGSSREPPPLEVVGRIGAGGYFGELSLLRGEPRAATVRAATRCELLALPRRDFEALLGPAKALLAAGASSYGRVGGENLFFFAVLGGGSPSRGFEETKEGEEEAEVVEISTHCSSNLAPSLFLFRSFFLI